MKKKLHFLSALLVAMLLIPWHLNAQILSENFDNLGSGIPTDWTVEGTATGYHWSVYEYGPYGDSGKSLSFNSYWAGRGTTSILKIPFSLKNVTKTHLLKFVAKNADSGSQASYKVCISEDGGATYTTVLATVPYNSSEWQEFEISLVAYTGKDNLCLVFDNVSGYNGRQYLDNLEIAPAPTCARATDLKAVPSQRGATLTWKTVAGINPASNYDIYVIDASKDTVVRAQNVSVTPDANGVYTYVVDPEEELLASSQQYYFSVQGVCTPTDIAQKVDSDPFYTLCDASALPINIDLRTDSTNPFMPCWTTNGSVESLGSDYAYIKAGYYSDGDYFYLISPEINFAANDIEVEFEYISSGETGFVYGLASSSNLSDFDSIGHLDILDQRGTIIFNTATTKFADSKNKMLVLKFDDKYSYIQAIKIYDKPCCPKPLGVTVAAVDSSSISVDWNGVASSFNIIVTDTADITKKPDTINVTTKPAIVKGLDPQTVYSVELQAICTDCGEGETESPKTSPVYVKTMCGVAGEVKFLQEFDGLDDLNLIPECWFTDVPGSWDANSSSGNNYIEMRGAYVDEGKTSILVTQPFVIAETNAGNYDVAFDMERLDVDYAADQFELNVLVNSAPSVEGAIKIATINRSYKQAPIESKAGWYNYQFNIPASVKGTVYLIFEGESNNMNSKCIRLDKVQVLDKPTCRRVSEITIGKPTTNSLPLSWIAEEGQTAWIVDYEVLKGAEVIKFDSLLVFTNPYTIEGLPASSALTIRGTITASCGEESKSEAVAFEWDFQTECAAVALPFFESFENQTFPPICWTSENTEGATDFLWSANSDSDYPHYKVDGEGCAYLGSNSTASRAILSTPELSFADNTDYRIEFYVYRYSVSSGYDGCGVNVYLSEDPEDTDFIDGEATYLTYIPYSANVPFVAEGTGAKFNQPALGEKSAMYRVRLDFNTEDIKGKYVIFEGLTAGGASKLSIDALWIGLKPEVDAVDAFTIDSIGAEAIALSHTEATVTTFDLVYGTPGFNPESETTNIITNISGNAYILKGLADNTEYEVYLRGRNGDKLSAWSKTPVKFRTKCLPFNLDANTIFVESFEEYTGSDFGCWSQVGKYDYIFSVKESYEYRDNTALPAHGNKMAYLAYTYGTWMFRAIELKAGENYSISASAQDCNADSPNFVLTFGLASNADVNAVSKLSTKTVAKLAGWERVTSYFTVPNDGTYFVAIGAEDGRNVLLDSIVVKKEAVIPPTVTFTSLDVTTATFNITSDATAWDLYYSTKEFAPDTIAEEQLIALTQKTYTFEKLTAKTKYYYALRAKDDKGNVSTWSSVESFMTACEAKVLPFTEGFEDGLDCWRLALEGGEVSINASEKTEGSQSVYIKESKGKFISPKVDGDLSKCVASVMLRNKWGYSRYITKIVAGVMTDPLDLSTFKAVSDTFALSQTDGFVKFSFNFSEIVGTEYANAKYVAFDVINPEAGTYFDEFVIATRENPAAPVFSPAPGEDGKYTSQEAINVTLSCATEGASILYSLNYGSDDEVFTDYVEGTPIVFDAAGDHKLAAKSVLYGLESDVVVVTYIVVAEGGNEGTDIENAELLAMIYAKDGMVYVNTEVGNMIEVFTVQGQCIYASEATAQLTTINALNAEVVLVKVNNEIVKVAVK